MADPADEQLIQPLVGAIPPSVVSTSKMLKTYSKLVAVLADYARSDRTDATATAAFEKKIRPILTDSGCGRKAVSEIVEACSKVSMPSPASKLDSKEDDKDVKAAADSMQNLTLDTARPKTDQADGAPATQKPKKAERATVKSKTDSTAATETTSSTISKQSSLAPDAKDAHLSLIHATSQESRFYLDATDTASLEVDLKDVTITLAGRELLQNAHLRLKSGVHYGLVGRNGSGKSTLLAAIGERIIPGLPNGLKILLVSQIATARQAAESEANSVLDVVVRSDLERTRAEAEVQALNAVLEQSTVAEDGVRDAVLRLRLRRATDRLEEARKIAIKRSGARGALARKDLVAAEREHEEAKADVERATEMPLDGSWTEEAAKMLLDAQRLLESVEANTTEARARKILHGLGFSASRIEGPYSALSGGWRSRASLAAALLQPAHILLLDEPVNYLDLPAVLFVQTFIKDVPHTVVTVSHDREFLDEVTDELIILRQSSLSYHSGNLTEVEREKRKKRKHALRQQEALDRKKEKVQKSIADVAKKAKKSGDDNKMRMVKSRQKKLDDRWGLEVNAKGHRFKLNRDLGGYHLTSRGGVEIETLDSEISFFFPDPDDLRFPGSLVHMEKVSYRYEGAPKATLRDVNLTIGPGERVALVGPNGHGKTTLLNALTGKLTPTAGKVERHSRVKIAIYAQHTIEDLLSSCRAALAAAGVSTAATSTVDAAGLGKKKGSVAVAATIPGTTALSHFLASTDGRVDEAQARAFLGQLGLKGRTADTVLLTGLSGGQLVRLGLAEVMWSAPDLVILDEVTTHLDADTIDALVRALRSYRGAVLLVSHDRYAVKRIIEMAKDPAATGGGDSDDSDSDDDEDDGADVDEDELEPHRKPGRTYLVKDGTMRLLERGMDEYTDSVVKKVLGGSGPV
ncbi:uncharacterized protein PFL1_00405 [Pseudozyma flocculosa PF-1]|uniref:Related to positive effector protein GCN20 n=1 Tax=Pseudozyma flocculosa TaxID=84751 RepID=A0A5C3ERJ1_9BASI|nr:uncharacterized protein PFL1_00405 [Pseudozyma flocculosa PF-1]EPQ32208.1 hypothetical protein PFL1_00405 [Pseudozyma flocculosa PF-1]SPO34848.1 related to positive effector protein GCN20 [Pseudozyma flocculosa]